MPSAKEKERIRKIFADRKCIGGIGADAAFFPHDRLQIYSGQDMNYLNEYKNFVNSRYLSEGLRITAGILIPALVLNYFGHLATGTIVSLGALGVTVTDNPGPIQHRRNGMLACSFIIFLVSYITALIAPYPVLLGINIVIICFVFSMIGVFGARASSIGLAALLVMVLSLRQSHIGVDPLINSLLILAGGLWYTLLSLLLYSFRPFKLIKQELGDCFLETAEYLRIRSQFYGEAVDYEDVYQQMLQQQIKLQDKQNLIRELLFKSRNIIKETTNTGRTLVVIFVEIVDLFERVTTSYQDYKALHTYFQGTDILQRFRRLILALVKEINLTGVAIKSDRPAFPSNSLKDLLKDTKLYYRQYVADHRNAGNVAGFISLRHIFDNIEDMVERIHVIQLYTTYKRKINKSYSELDYDRFISKQNIEFRLFANNLSLKSNTFRHAVRVSIAALSAYIVSIFFPLGHGYWIMMTTIIILRPNYALSKKRNIQRVLGTIAGAVIGMVILIFVEDKSTLFALMIFFMIATYTTIRRNYLWGVVLLTPYVLLLFHLISPLPFMTALYDRLLDTGIGSAIAFLASFFLVPSWEKEQINTTMCTAISDNKDYFKVIADVYTGNPVPETDYKVKRKNAFVSIANLSNAFTRLLSEPKSKRKNSALIFEFVVLNHTLASHIATLAYYMRPLAAKYASQQFIPIIEEIVRQFEVTQQLLSDEKVSEEGPLNTKKEIFNQVEALLEKRQSELNQGLIDTDTRKSLSEFKAIADQFYFISKFAIDIRRVTEKMKAASA